MRGATGLGRRLARPRSGTPDLRRRERGYDDGSAARADASWREMPSCHPSRPCGRASIQEVLGRSVALNEWLDVSGRDQSHLMAQPFELARPIMGTRARSIATR